MKRGDKAPKLEDYIFSPKIVFYQIKRRRTGTKARGYNFCAINDISIRLKEEEFKEEKKGTKTRGYHFAEKNCVLLD